MTETDLDSLTKDELKAKLDEEGIEYSESDTKAELIDKLEGDGADEAVEDPNQDEEAASSGGTDVVGESHPSESEPERRPVDVDVADIEDPDAEYEGEIQAPLNAESWVTLDGSDDQVPDELDGKVAAVVSWPVSVEHDTDTGETITYASPEGYYTVQERGQGILLSVTADAFKEIHTHGRPDVFA